MVKASIDRTAGWAKLQFPWDVGTIAVLKEYPGSQWDPSKKVWWTPLHSWDPVLSKVLKYEIVNVIPQRQAVIPDMIAKRLKPYQLECAQFLIQNAGALAVLDPRLGKTPTAIAAMIALMQAGIVARGFVSYPSQVSGEWKRQLKQWANIDLVEVQSHTRYTDVEIAHLRSIPYLVLGCSYELLQERGEDVFNVMQGWPYCAIADEIQNAKNRKSERTKELLRIAASPWCLSRIGTTGTPMRNRPRDLWAAFEFCYPNSMGGYWSFAKRYAAAFEGTYGWDDKGQSNEKELHDRLDSLSFRRTRAEVASWLPKTDRKVIQCNVKDKKLLAKYKSLEQALAGRAMSAIGDSTRQEDREALEQLVAITTEAKIPTLIERLIYNSQDLGVKVLVGAHFHETLQSVITAAEAAQLAGKITNSIHIAGGWKTDSARKKAIVEWQAAPKGAILFANFLSSGIGIDLSDADVSLNAELAWVPADCKQWEDRVVDVHQGKRTTPPRQEYFLCKDTIDEAMAATILKKIRANEAIVGTDVESRNMASTLRGAEIVGPARLGLPSTDAETVKAALLSARDRWLSDPSDKPVVSDAQIIAGGFTDWDFDAETSDQETIREE